MKTLQDNRAYADSLGLWTVVRGAYNFSNSPSPETLLAITGYDFAPHLMTIGERIINLERMILNREGMTRADDSLPVRMQEPVPTGPAADHAISASMLDSMLDEYYEERGWDGQGVPRPETIERLNLAQWVISA